MLRYPVVLVLTMFLLVFLPQSVFANHGQLPHWVNDSQDQKGAACCGEQDCIPVNSVHILGEAGERALVSIEGKVGFIYAHRLVRKCPQERPQSFLCTYTAETINGIHEMCLLKKIDGTAKELRVTPDCIRCLLIIECGGDQS